MHDSEQLFTQSQTVIPGGVNSPVRAFKSVGGSPIFLKKGKGAYVIDVEGKYYIDYVGSWGALILGHADSHVIDAVQETLFHGLSFGAPTELEWLLASKITQLMPSIEKIRMLNSGTEATMTAVRLARGITGCQKIIKFNGCYHGHSDGLLVKPGSGVLTLSLPSSPGIPESITAHTLTAEYNDLKQTAELFEQYHDDIAAVIIEPVAGNMGFVMPTPEFLSGLRQLCDATGALLIFDEVMTGFRVGLGGAQALFNIRPDLTTLGKVMGGGMPVGALGGQAKWMDHLAPEGPVYQAGTLAGNPLTMAAGLATLRVLEDPAFYVSLAERTSDLVQGLKERAHEAGLPFYADYLGGMFGFCFTNIPKVRNLQDVAASDETLFKQFFHGMLQKGIYFAPSLYEAGFLSNAHEEEELSLTLKAAQVVFEALAKVKTK